MQSAKDKLKQNMGGVIPGCSRFDSGYPSKPQPSSHLRLQPRELKTVKAEWQDSPVLHLYLRQSTGIEHIKVDA